MGEKISYEELKKMAKKLEKKYLGKEFSLLELDNLMQEEVDTNSSLYDDFDTAMDQGWCYEKETIEFDVGGIQVNFDLLEKVDETDDRGIFNVKVKVTNIDAV